MNLLQEIPQVVDWAVLIQLLLQTMITVFVPVIAAFAVSWLRTKSAEIKSQIPVNQMALAEQLIAQFVKAAEQSGLKNELMAAGSAKKAMVLQLAETELTKKGINLDLEVLSAMIEAAVYEEFTKSKEPEAPADAPGEEPVG